MAAINFPDDPTQGEYLTVDGRTWQWTGLFWRSANVQEIESLDGGSPDTETWGSTLDGGSF